MFVKNVNVNMRYPKYIARVAVLVLLFASITPASAQSLEVFNGKRTVKGVPVELTGGIRSS